MKTIRLHGSLVKQAIKRQNPGFNERAHGFRAFNELLLEAQKARPPEARRRQAGRHLPRARGRIIRQPGHKGPSHIGRLAHVEAAVHVQDVACDVARPSGEQRNNAASTMFSASPGRPSGICLMKLTVTFVGHPFAHARRSMNPGAIAFTVMFCRANSRAGDFPLRAMITRLCSRNNWPDRTGPSVR